MGKERLVLWLLYGTQTAIRSGFIQKAAWKGLFSQAEHDAFYEKLCKRLHDECQSRGTFAGMKR